MITHMKQQNGQCIVCNYQSIGKVKVKRIGMNYYRNGKMVHICQMHLEHHKNQNVIEFFVDKPHLESPPQKHIPFYKRLGWGLK